MAEATLILSGGRVNDKPNYLFVDKAALEENRIKITDEDDINANCLVSVGWPRIDTRIIIVNPDSFRQCKETKLAKSGFPDRLSRKDTGIMSMKQYRTFRCIYKGHIMKGLS